MHPTIPPSGWVADRAHHFAIRVYFEDTDAGGVVYHATYLRFAERARTEFLRATGVPHCELMHDAGLVFVVRSAAVEYLRTARLDDSLLVVTRVARLGGASVMLDQHVMRGDEAIATLRIGLVATDIAAAKARRIPPRWRRVFAALAGDEEGTGEPPPAKES
jgi:acyl-CoA thioester hydrolase